MLPCTRCTDLTGGPQSHGNFTLPVFAAVPESSVQCPLGWTSADAAGLPILLGLIIVNEVFLRGRVACAPIMSNYAHSSGEYALCWKEHQLHGLANKWACFQGQ